MKTISLFALGFIILLLMSCDPDGNGEYKINNLSDEDVRVAYIRFGDTVSTHIPANTKERILNEGGIGERYSVDDEFQRPSAMFDTVFLALSDSTHTVTKDILLDENWFFHKLSKYDGEYTYSIQNKDIQ